MLGMGGRERNTKVNHVTGKWRVSTPALILESDIYSVSLCILKSVGSVTDDNWVAKVNKATVSASLLFAPLPLCKQFSKPLQSFDYKTFLFKDITGEFL